MDGSGVATAEGCEEPWREGPEAGAEALALLLRYCLLEWVRGPEPAAEAWARVLARISASCSAPARAG